MIFTNIRLQNYRSYDEASFDLGSGVNIVVGPNAVGKTNLLEALMVIAHGKSFRSNDFGLVMHDKNWTRLDVYSDDNSARVLKIKKITDDKTEKTFEIDSKTYKRLSQKNKQPVVLFQPDDLRLLHADPSLRREYFDNLLEQYVPGYSKIRRDLRRVLVQRNALLKTEEVGNSQLFAWNIRLSEISDKIISERLKLVEYIDNLVAETYHKISTKNSNVSLEYSSKINLDNYGNNLLKYLEANQEVDKTRGFTGRGPHRDDFIAYFNDALLSDSASRGETRTFLLAFKIIELKLLEEKTGKRPLLLLDDVFSELDGSRRKALTTFLHDYQTIITTTDADVVLKNFSSSANTIVLQ